MSQGMDELIGDTLALVNSVRGAFGKELLNELPDATRGQSGDCLYYRALADVGVRSVGGDGVMEFEDERKTNVIASLWGVEKLGDRMVKAPSQFGEVIAAFDNNLLPAYSINYSDEDEEEYEE
jgi:hypothetical protein